MTLTNETSAADLLGYYKTEEALGENVKLAQARAYEEVNRIAFDGMQCRRDIGARAIAAARP